MGGKGGARSSVARRPRGPRGPYEGRLWLVRPLIFKARLRIITTTATAQLQLCLQKHYLFALSLHKPSLSSAQSLHGRLLLLLRLALLRCSLARTVSSRFPPPPRLSSPVRYRTCVVMYTACLCKGGDLSRAPTSDSPDRQTDTIVNSVGLRDPITAVKKHIHP